jgi:Mn2+/Fe2+ NRAMP family transporter
MGEYVNTTTFNIVAWVTAIAMILLTFVVVYTSVFPSVAGASPP